VDPVIDRNVYDVTQGEVTGIQAAHWLFSGEVMDGYTPRGEDMRSCLVDNNENAMPPPPPPPSTTPPVTSSATAYGPTVPGTTCTPLPLHAQRRAR
jgi:hypothetical protein